MGRSAFSHAKITGITAVVPERCVNIDDELEFFNIDQKLLERNNNGSGSDMVFIASRGGVRTDPGMTSYAGTKGALIATMQSIAKELAPSGVRVNCVSPALIQTNMADETSRQYAAGKYPMGLGTVPDVANVVVFLLAQETHWISGQNYLIECGMA